MCAWMARQGGMTDPHRTATRRRRRGLTLGLAVFFSGTAAVAWTPLSVDLDPLIRMPGTQHSDGVVLEGAGNCMNCHAGYDATVEPGSHWKGSMMAQAARDPLFWASVAVAAQDSIWATGRPNATDICIRCHSPGGWLGGRSDPTNGAALVGDDFDGVACGSCHKTYDPFFEDTAAGLREGNDWSGYWDEANASGTPSSTAAATTLAADRVEAAKVRLFNGNTFYGANRRPVSPGWTEHGGGQMFVSATAEERGPFADAGPKHKFMYSRHHRSRYFCATCHDVSNPVLANLSHAGTAPGDGTTVLPTETQPAHAYFHVERTFSEFRLSAYGQGAGADGVGPFAPQLFDTSRAGNLIATCQDCHMADGVGRGANKNTAVLRPTDSVEHPHSGVPTHDLMGGNAFVPLLLASAVTGSPNHDATNAALLNQGPATLTANLTAGQGLDPVALIAASNRALTQLQRAASLQGLSYQSQTGALAFRIQNNTGHKLISGYPEGRRVFVNVRVYTGGNLVHEVNPYDHVAGTLRGLPASYSPNSPALGPGQVHRDELVYEAKMSSDLTGEDTTFHFALATSRYKDDRIPPKGFRIAEAMGRLSEPVWQGTPNAAYFTLAEYQGGYDDVALGLPTGADGIVVSLFYQTTSREYVEFLRDEIGGTGGTLPSPGVSGDPAYLMASDPFFSGLVAWGPTIWSLWDHNKAMPGAAPVLMAEATIGSVGNPCAPPGSNGTPCNDGNLCTVGDTCQAGACHGTTVSCTAQDACHGAGVCDAATGLCTQPLLTDGTPCDDADACTLTDACSAGACVGGNPVVCTAQGVCHVSGTCDSVTGQCSNPLADDGTLCPGGACLAGTCVATDAGSDPEPEAGVDAAPDVVTETSTDAPWDTGSAGSAGIGGSAGMAGTAGSAGMAGTAGSAGMAGTAGSAGMAGSGGATGGSGGATGGSGGYGGTGGFGGSVGGSGGTGGYGGSTGGIGGSGGTGSPDAGPGASEDDGGCGCTTPGSRPNRQAWMVILGLAAALASRRRRTVRDRA